MIRLKIQPALGHELDLLVNIRAIVSVDSEGRLTLRTGQQYQLLPSSMQLAISTLSDNFGVIE